MTEPATEDWPYPVAPFVCHQCGNCCRGDGFVELTDEEIDRMAKHLGLTRDDFLGRYGEYHKPSRKWHLIDQDDDLQSCIFLQPDNSCRVHEAKPDQCRNFPMAWRPDNILEFCEGWRAAAGLPPAPKRTMTEH